MTNLSQPSYWKDQIPFGPYQEPKALDGDMMALHITLRGRLISYAIPESMQDLLMRPGILDAAQDAAWTGWIGDFVEGGEVTRVMPLPASYAPVDRGALFIDYDAKSVISFHDGVCSTEVGLVRWKIRSRQSTAPYERWVACMLEANMLPVAVWLKTGKQTPVDPLPADTRWRMRALEDQVRKKEELVPVGSDNVETLVNFPLVKKGWSFHDVAFHPEQALPAVQESVKQWPVEALAQWQAWAMDPDRIIDSPTLLAPLFRGALLDRELPAPSVGRKAGPRF